MTPSIFGRYPKNIDLHASKYKAEDWANFLHHYSLPLFRDNINDATFMMWKEFAMGALLATKTEITSSDINDAETAFATFLNYYYQKVYQRKRDRLMACTYTIHALCHVSQCMKWWGPLSIIWQFACERYCGLVKNRCKSRVYSAANIHEILKVRAGLQAISRTTYSGISLQNKSHLDDARVLKHATKDLQFLRPRRAHIIKDNMELEALKSIIAKELQKRAEDVTVDSEILHSIYSWDRMKLEGVTIGSSSSGFSDRAVSRENYFIRIRHQNQQRNRLYTYRDKYAKVIHYLELRLLPGRPPLLLAYVQQYSVLLSFNLVEQRDPTEPPLYIHAGTIRALLGRFQCHGRTRNGHAQKIWFIDRDRMYKTMRTLSGYHLGRIDVTDDSDVEVESDG